MGSGPRPWERRENRYQDREVVETQPPVSFYVVSRWKLTVLFIATLGLYVVYWSYKNWSIWKSATGARLWPVMRGIFLIFFIHDLFGHVDKKLRSSQHGYHWRPQLQAHLIFLCAILTSVSNIFVAKGIGSPYFDIVGSVWGLLIIFPMLKAQQAINICCGDPNGESNDRLTVANWIWTILGGLIWLVSLLGVYIMIFEPELL